MKPFLWFYAVKNGLLLRNINVNLKILFFRFFPKEIGGFYAKNTT